MDSTNSQLKDPKSKKIRVIRLKYRSRLYGLHYPLSLKKHHSTNKLRVSEFKSPSSVSDQLKSSQSSPMEKTPQNNTNNNEIDEIFSKCKPKLNESKAKNQTPTTTVKTKKPNKRTKEDKLWCDSRGIYRDSTGLTFPMLF